MKHLLLKLFTTKELWKEILNREVFEEPEREVDVPTLWAEVFHKNPLLVEFLKKREIDLLKRSTVRDVSSDFILGQIAENRLWRSYNVALPATRVEAPPQEEKVIEKESFLQKWNKVK